jgi:hypothetical protein
MTEVTALRLYVMRATYLLIAVGLGSEIWPTMLHHAHPWSLMHGVANSLLAAVTLMAVVGIRYPLRMLPLLLFELTWKSIWLVAIAWPLWSAHEMDADTWETVYACLMGIIIFPIAIPWRYVLANYVARSGDRWRLIGPNPARS